MIVMRISKLFLALLMSLSGAQAMAIEEPVFSVLETASDYEIRRYEPFIVAEVDVRGNFDDAGNSAFRILAKYIFGDNSTGEKMKMTAPVKSSSVRMAMTAPVITYTPSNEPGGPDQYAYIGETRQGSDETGLDKYTYAFVIERKYTMDTVPAPNDSRIKLKRNAPRVLAVRRFSGRWTEANYARNEQALIEALQRDDVGAVGQPLLARYNSPFSLWFLRRNEVMVEIIWPVSPVQATSE
jgi:hypothetical protein